MLTTDFEVHHPKFHKLVFGNTHLEKLWSGCRWAEGPVYFPAGKYLLWSDIPNNRMLRWDETDGSVSVFRQPSHCTNGHTVDRQGRLVSCEHQGRCISRTELDGTRTVLVSEYNGARLNSPNDVVVKSDDTIWFTDPSYGIDSEYEGDAAASEVGSRNVYRFDPQTRNLAAIVTNFVQPNGLAFSPDESVLYVVDSGATHSENGPRHVRRFTVNDVAPWVSGGDVFIKGEIGIFDGLRIDTSGNIWLSAPDGVHCYDPDGLLLGKILVPEVVANLCFGGLKRNRLFICGTTSLYAVYVNAQGCKR
jgi:gluconolactonase